MQVRILDLDGSVPEQLRLGLRQPPTLSARHWGPRLRIASAHHRFNTFERQVADWLKSRPAPSAVTLVGSGDFHHVTLALVRQMRTPFNLLVLDKHPDWVRGVPFLHCGTWLHHAAQLPMVQTIFHAGGDVDFDNGWRWLAPWRLLRERKIVVFPALRSYNVGPWSSIAHQPLRPRPEARLNEDRLESLLEPHRLELARYPLYITVDKDVMRASEAVVNWDSGHLDLEEVLAVVSAFRRAANQRLAGADIVGDWSPVRTQGLIRRWLHWTEHPALHVDPAAAQRINKRANLALLKALGASLAAEEEAWRRQGAA